MFEVGKEYPLNGFKIGNATLFPKGEIEVLSPAVLGNKAQWVKFKIVNPYTAKCISVKDAGPETKGAHR